MTIEKRYKDIDADWFVPDQEQAVYQLSCHYDDVELVLTELRAGHIIQTTHALFRWVPSDGVKARRKREEET